MAKRKRYHVTPGTDGGWKVKEENASRASSNHDTKADAVSRAKELAKNQDLGQVVIHKQDGTIQTEHTYGKGSTRRPDYERIRDRLLEFEEEEWTADPIPEADRLIEKDNFAFLLGATLDRGMRAEIIWKIPYLIKQEIGHLDPRKLSVLKLKQIKNMLARLPGKPRWMQDAPRTILELARMVSKEFAGNAKLIWRKRKAQEVMSLLTRIHGVGEGIASMVVLILHRDRGVRFSDLREMNVKPDIHVKRVLFRLGIASSESKSEAIRAAASLNPDYPGALDQALWEIGRRWCKKTHPDCRNCWMDDLCAKVG